MRKNLFKLDSNNREINIDRYTNCQLVGDNIFYPNCRILQNDEIYNPIDEVIMSLKNVEVKVNINKVESNSKFETPLFFFIYNTDNYFHFLYDTLPYLISFKKLKEEIINLKLLMNYPNHQSNKFYPFVKEMLDILDIKDDDIVIADNSTIYSEIYVSSSYTHGIDSNKPPREEIYSFYKDIVSKVTSFKTDNKYPKKIYISRRTWLHNDFSNIGTNYTQRRRMENEDELVEYLKSIGYEEVFTEKLSTIEKIEMFSSVESVVSAIGGGSCNVLFSNENCKHYCIVSPTFLDVNYRFIYSLDKVKTHYIKETEHLEKDNWKKYMRVRCGDVIGEVEEVYRDKLLVSYTDKFVAGWNSQMKLKKELFEKRLCNPLDSGLNSPWKISDIGEFKKLLKNKNC